MKDNNISNLKEKLQNYHYISFDLFDTLVFRTISESFRIFDIVVELFNNRTCKNFKKERIKAERKARIAREGSEVDLQYIYSFLNYKNEVKKKLMKLEKECEISNCVPNKPMVELANWCYNRGYKVVITTDMYLDRQTLEAILSKIGVQYHSLFISSEERVTKRSGRLFKVLLEKLDISPKEIVHIGDDPHNDIEMAQANGIESFVRICNDINGNYYFKKKDDIVSDHLKSLIREKSREVNGDLAPFRIGYSVIGPLMYDFCHWVHQVRERCQLERLLFLAREGYLIKKCYDILYPEEKDSVAYISLNKNLLRLPMLSHGDSRKIFIESLPLFNTITWDDLLDLLLVSDKKKFISLLSSAIPSIDTYSPIKREELIHGVYDEELAWILDKQKDVISKQEMLLKQYLKEYGLWDKKVGLVNNSINGSGQNGIELFVKKNGGTPSVLGLQFIASRKCKERLCSRFYTYLGDRKASGYCRQEFYHFCLVFEHLLFEPVSTAKCFSSDGENVIIEHSCLGMEKENFSIVGKIHDYALEFVNDYVNNISFDLSSISYKMLMKMIHFPYIEDANLIGNLYDNDVYGSLKLIPDVSYKLMYSINRKVPNSVRWIEGYLIQRGMLWFNGILLAARKKEAFCRHFIMNNFQTKFY